MKSGVISIIGRPSAGKSTLVNTLCGHKVSIVAEHPQTTRNVIRGIVTEPRGQLVLLDTPGFHASDKKLNLYLKAAATQSLPDVDLVLYVIDSTRAPGEEEQQIVNRIAGLAAPLVVTLAKTDLESRMRETLRSFVRERLPRAPICEISALTGQGIDALRDLLFERAPAGEPLYDPEFYTDQPPEFRAAEIIREQASWRVREEVPHALYVDIEDMEERNTGKSLWIRAVIAVERESQKGILIGKGGSVIHDIRVGAQRELAAIFPYQVSLDLRVKVQPKWRQDDRLLKRLIY